MRLSPRVGRLRAPNPSPMTLDGTNGYVLDGGSALVAVDPGPDSQVHRDAFVAIGRERDLPYAAILVTHGHPDHFPGAAPLARATGARVYAHAAATFPHDAELADGERLRVGDLEVRAIEAPGHARDHLVFALDEERALFTGDVIIGTGTVVIAPPGGDMRVYQQTLRRLRDAEGDAAAIYGGHGPEVRDPRAKIEEYVAHRAAREAEIVAELARGPATIPALVERIYAAIDRRLWPAAARQVLAYLLALEREGAVTAAPAGREPTDDERRLLDPDLRAVADPVAAAVMRAELGFGEDAPPLVVYRLLSS